MLMDHRAAFHLNTGLAGLVGIVITAPHRTCTTDVLSVGSPTYGSAIAALAGGKVALHAEGQAIVFERRTRQTDVLMQCPRAAVVAHCVAAVHRHFLPTERHGYGDASLRRSVGVGGAIGKRTRRI